MSKFRFGQNNVSTIGHVRVNNETYDKLKLIAVDKGVTIQEVVRVFIDVALDEYEREQPDKEVANE